MTKNLKDLLDTELASFERFLDNWLPSNEPIYAQENRRIKKEKIEWFTNLLTKCFSLGQQSTLQEVDENTSDGHHTFKELYEHRIALYIALCRELVNDEYIWCSTLHSDGSSFQDWFVLGIGDEKGKQITYHLPARFWSEVCEFANVREKAPEWDGHTAQDVITRLSHLKDKR